MKNLIKQITPPILLNFMKRIIKSNYKYHGAAMLDKKIQKYLNYTNGFFVELGANDGISQSNTLYFEKYKEWKGILIEPTPHNYLKCLANRSSSNHIFCNACVSLDYDSKFVEIAFANLMSSPIGLESDISDPLSHAKSGKQFLNPTDKNFSFGAVAKTLNQILIDSNAPSRIDFLSLDVEGAEIEVLKGIDHKLFRFKYMCIECRNIEKMTHYLEKHGYSFVEKLSIHDYLFKDLSWPNL
ncbi:MAG: FkbM family methyltransferase [Spirobacillus cienkowskii]|jgi:FkbM family methyltransferase|uniref:FkbM family methyltransferase n=1 Tax=Spirobacillus cienkowskii TaxID=495820 RepID=A0A369KNS7_9BACT|nr:MAG: FkbM family methyltransferase [Spirobacillus cienkowskii]